MLLEMDVVKKLERRTVLSILVLISLTCVVVFKPSSIPFHNVHKSWLWKSQLEQGRGELGKVLQNASMPDRTVILTTLNDAWTAPGSIFDLFLESFRIGEGTQRLLNHLVVIAMDETAYSRCKTVHPHCFHLTTPGVNFTSEKRFMSPDYLKLMWRRIDFLRVVLELGYNFVFTDADIMWFRDPFPHFDSIDEIQFSCDYYRGPPMDRGNSANGGFNYVKSGEETIEFYKYWYMARILHPKLHDQSVFEKIKHDPAVVSSGLRIRYLDTMYFGGFCQPSRNLSNVCTMHANCCVGIERKIHDLRLILDDWRKFKAASIHERKSTLSTNSSPWRAPNECKVF